MEVITQQLDINTLLQIATVLVILVSLRWRLPSKDDIKRLDHRINQTNADMKEGFALIDERFAQQDAKFEARFAQQDAKFEERFAQQDAKIEDLRGEMRAGFQRVDDRFTQQDAKIDDLRQETKADFQHIDTRIDNLRMEIKADIQRVEDRAAEANEFHAKSVALLDGILRQLQERREPL